MAKGDLEKKRVRDRIWSRFEESGEALFPGARGRIPNFRGAAAAADRLAATPEWRRARVVKCNPDAPQRPVRLRALREGKVVYMAVPRLAEAKCFWKLDPSRLDPRQLRDAATIRGASRLGRPVSPRELPHVDLIVAGSVAVNRKGVRVGKGGGYSDLEYAIGREVGAIDAKTVVATTVHPIQVVGRRAAGHGARLLSRPDRDARGDDPSEAAAPAAEGDPACASFGGEEARDPGTARARHTMRSSTSGATTRREATAAAPATN